MISTCLFGWLVGWLVNLLRRLGSGCTISWMLYPTRGKQQSTPHSQTSRLGMVVIAEVIYSYRCCVSFIVVGVLLPTDMSPIPVTRTRDACRFTATVATRTDGPLWPLPQRQVWELPGTTTPLSDTLSSVQHAS
jgi:hypothetical protein